MTGLYPDSGGGAILQLDGSPMPCVIGESGTGWDRCGVYALLHTLMRRTR
jgi:hypothetical protein